MQARMVLNAKATLGEGALWDARRERLWWVDIMGERLHRFDPVAGVDEQWAVGQPVGTVVLNEAGGVLLAVEEGLATFDLGSGQLDVVARPADKGAGIRYNDGKCGPDGRFWAGTMAYDMRVGAGALYRLDTDWRLHKVLDGVTISNGLVWSADGRTMYYIDSPTREVVAFDYDVGTGAIGKGQVAIRVPVRMGVPDGMDIDVDGRLWIAHHGDGAVRCWDAEDGRLLATVDVPTPKTTSCAFGGPGMDQLFITSAGGGEDEADEWAGGLFVVEPGVRGWGSYRFGG